MDAIKLFFIAFAVTFVGLSTIVIICAMVSILVHILLGGVLI